MHSSAGDSLGETDLETADKTFGLDFGTVGHFIYGIGGLKQLDIPVLC